MSGEPGPPSLGVRWAAFHSGQILNAGDHNHTNSKYVHDAQYLESTLRPLIPGLPLPPPHQGLASGLTPS